jgi:hypothetical protein
MNMRDYPILHLETQIKVKEQLVIIMVKSNLYKFIINNHTISEWSMSNNHTISEWFMSNNHTISEWSSDMV